MADLDWTVLNEGGLWCSVCGRHLARPDEVDAEDFQEPENCRQCGAPDEIDPEAI